MWPRLVCPLCAPAAQADELGRTSHSVDADTVYALVQQALRLSPARVVLRGGETILRQEALELLAILRASGVAELALWTAGPLLARPGLAQALQQAGATGVGLVLFGESAAGHDYVTQTPGHFSRVLAGAQAARRAGLQVCAIVPVLRPTFRGLQGLVQKAIPAGISSLHFWVPPGPDREAHPLLAPLPVVAPHLQAALHVARTAGLVVHISGVPPCQLAGHAALADPDDAVIATQPRGAPEPEFGPICPPCTWRSRCSGVAAARATAHGWVGVAARTDPFALANLPARLT